MVRNYLGEKFAFEFAFIMHYNAWLMLAAFAGVVLFIYQIWMTIDHEGDSENISTFAWFFKLEQDTPFNALYCIFICIWAVIFVESWKRKEAQFINTWDCDEIRGSSADERTQFTFFQYYNE